MTPFGLDRRRNAPDDAWLGQKMAFFVAGAAVGAAGMISGRSWIVYIAIAILLLGLVLRILGRRTSRREAAAAPADWASFDDARTEEADDARIEYADDARNSDADDAGHDDVPDGPPDEPPR
jgi:hypothetical protein